MAKRGDDTSEKLISTLCCSCFTAVLAGIGVIIWLARRPNEPKCYLAAFTVPPLNTATNFNATTNFSMGFMVDFHNENNNIIGIHYVNLNITVGVFLNENTTSLIGRSTIDGFYQGRTESNVQKWSSVESHGKELVNQTVRMVDGKRYFRVDFSTSVRYTNLFYHTGRHKLWGGANVAVNDEGLKDESDSIRLGHYVPVITQSGVPSGATGCHGMLLLVVGVILCFVV